MAFGNSRDPRYRGNQQIYLVLVLAAFIAAGSLTGLFWYRAKKSDGGTSRVEEAPVVSAIPAASSTPAPTPLSTEEAERQEKLRNLRAEMVASRDWERIGVLAQEILVIEPEDGQAWSYAGRSHESKGDLTEAMAAYERSVASPTATYYYFYLKARLHRKQGDLPAAIACLEQARQLKTDSVILSNLILIFKIQAGKSDEVRSLVGSYEKVDLQSNADQWLLGAAALALRDGDKAKAAALGTRFRNLVNPEIFRILISDSFFDAYRPGFSEIFSKNPAE